MNLNIPSQKLFLFALPVILILGVFAMFFKQVPQTEQVKNNPEIVTIERSLLEETDSDSDGLKDWEEAVWETDPNNPETHGKPDKEYVVEQKNLIENSPLPETGGPVETTEELGQLLFAEYITLKQSGELTPTAIAQITNRLANSVVLKNPELPFVSADLRTFPDSDNAKMQAYSTALMQAGQRYSEIFQSRSNSVISQLSTSLDTAGFAEDMIFAGELYSGLAEEIMGFEVPASLVDAHTHYANSLQISAVGLKKLSMMNSEPLQSISGIQQHTQGQREQAVSINAITLFLNQNGIIDFFLSPL